MSPSIPEYTLTHSIADMHEDERPCERLLAYGASALSNAELLWRCRASVYLPGGAR